MNEQQRDDVSKADGEGLADLLGQGLSDSTSGGSGGGSATPESTVPSERMPEPVGDGSAAADVEPPRVEIEGYEIIRELSRGGQGVVYEALQRATKRKVALKVLVGGPYATKAARKRFEREIELVAQLKHPNIVTIFHSAVTPDGQQFCVMDYVRGRPLHKYVREKKLSLEETLGLVATVCDAVQYAHQRGVIHRDLKPSNIVVDADGNPKILDFGLAKQLAGPVETVVSVSQQVIGTLPYMSPEQTRGNPDEIDTRSDVYALGVVLYEALTGHYPYPVGGPLPEAVRRISETAPTPPRRKWTGDSGVTRRSTGRLRAGDCPIDSEVETILLKTLAKERERRYQSAGELARDLRHYLAGEPIEAKRDSGWYVLRKTLRRFRVPAGVALGFVALLVYSLAVTSALYFSEKEERQRAVMAEQQAEDREQIVRRRTYAHKMASAKLAWSEHRMWRMKELLYTCPPDQRGWEWYYLVRLSDRSVRTLHGHRGRLTSVSFDRDGRWIASGSLDRTVKVWDATSGECRFTSPQQDNEPECVVLTSDGSSAVWRSHEGAIRVWDLGTESVRTLGDGQEFAARSLALDHEERVVAAGGRDGLLKFFDIRTGAEVPPAVRGHDGLVRCVAFSPDRRRLASGGDDAAVKVWDVTTRKRVFPTAGHSGPVRCVAFSPDGGRIASASDDATLRLWDASTGEEIPRSPLRGHYGAVYCASFSADGKLLASGGLDRTLRVWNATSGENLLTLSGHAFAVVDVAFQPGSNRRIVSAGHDWTLKFWDTNIGAETVSLPGHEWDISSLAFSPDGRWIASGGLDRAKRGVLKVWAAGTGVAVQSFTDLDAEIVSVAFAPPDGRRLAFALNREVPKEEVSGVVTVLEWATAETVATLRELTDGVTCVSFSPDGSRIASAGRDGTVRLWDAGTGKEVPASPLRGHERWVECVAFSPDGQRIVSGSGDCTLKIWDARDGKEIRTLLGHDQAVRCVAFDPDGERIVSGSNDCTLKIWGAREGKEIRTLRAHEYDVITVAFSPDGRRIASGSHDYAVKIWDAESGEETLSIHWPEQTVCSVAFSPDGRRLASGGEGGKLLVFEAITRQELEKNPETVFQLGRAAAILMSSDQAAEAEPLLSEALDICEKINALDDLATRVGLRQVLQALIRICEQFHQPEHAARWRAKLSH